MGCYIPREKAEEDDEDNLKEDERRDVDGHSPWVPRLQHLTHLAQTHIDPFLGALVVLLDPRLNAQFGPTRSAGHRLLERSCNTTSLAFVVVLVSQNTFVSCFIG